MGVPPLRSLREDTNSICSVYKEAHHRVLGLGIQMGRRVGLRPPPIHTTHKCTPVLAEKGYVDFVWKPPPRGTFKRVFIAFLHKLIRASAAHHHHHPVAYYMRHISLPTSCSRLLGSLF